MSRETARRIFLSIAMSLSALQAAVAADAEPVTQVGPLALSEAVGEKAMAPPPMRLAESLSLESSMSLRRATEGAVDQVEVLKAWNAGGGNRPLKIGFSRPLAEPARVLLDADVLAKADYQGYAQGFVAESFTGSLVWGTHLRVADAHRLRLHLSDVKLPAGSRLWVWGLGEEPREFGLELLGPGGDLWTPSVGGGDAFLEVELPRAAVASGERFQFDLREVGEIFALGTVVKLGECLTDGSCVTSGTLAFIADYRKAVAHLEFVDGGGTFICTGGLLNDTDTASVVPYLLTANHCFEAQAAASTLEAFWDFRTASCNGTVPNPGSLPRSNGATLLASSADTDFTLVRLNGIPAGRFLLGWTATPVANGTTLHRLSHPEPGSTVFPQTYTRSVVSGSFQGCPGIPRPKFIYSFANQGGSFGGSSGAPIVLPGGQVVGQLLGACGPNPDDGCNRSNAEVDGAFAATFPSISRFLSPPVTSGPCVANASTLCVDRQAGDKRFKIQVAFQTSQGGGLSGAGTAIPLSSLGVNSGGLFWFFGASNPEMLVKVIDGCGVNQKFWVFYSAGTNAGLTTTVTDTVTGATKTYTNPDLTAAAPVQDTSALPCN